MLLTVPEGLHWAWFSVFVQVTGGDDTASAAQSKFISQTKIHSISLWKDVYYF